MKKLWALLALISLALSASGSYHWARTQSAFQYYDSSYKTLPEYVAPVPYPYYNYSTALPSGVHPSNYYGYYPQQYATYSTALSQSGYRYAFPPWLGGPNYWYNMPDEESRLLGPATSSTFPPAFLQGYYQRYQYYDYSPQSAYAQTQQSSQQYAPSTQSPVYAQPSSSQQAYSPPAQSPSYPQYSYYR